MKLAIVLLVVLMLVGCGNNVPPPAQVIPDITTLPVLSHFDVYRMVDPEAGVVCYLGYESISCLPLSETELDY